MSQERLYQDVARNLIAELAAGTYPVGSRLPAERELAIHYRVSRPTIRESIIALEVQGLVEVRVGSGAYVLRVPGCGDPPRFNVTAIELTEARLLFEGEAAALAAGQIDDSELVELEELVAEIARENQDPEGHVNADRKFHLTIARATRNTAVFDVVEQLWNIRSRSPEAALLHEKARTANVKPVIDEHSLILDALRERDAGAARHAMRSHLGAVLESLLFATEENAIAEARRLSQAKRERYARAMA